MQCVSRLFYNSLWISRSLLLWGSHPNLGISSFLFPCASVHLFYDYSQFDSLYDHSIFVSPAILHTSASAQAIFILMCSLLKVLFLVFFMISLLNLICSFLLTISKSLNLLFLLTLFNLFISEYFFSTYFYHFYRSYSSLFYLIVSISGILERASLILCVFYILKLIEFWIPFCIFYW